MPRRTQAQLALVAIGIIVWGVGLRIGDDRLGLVGIGFFAAATLLRFAKR